MTESDAIRDAVRACATAGPAEAEPGGWPGRDWARFEVEGFTRPDLYAEPGSEDALAVEAGLLAACGDVPVAAPLAENALACLLLAEGGIPHRGGVLTIARAGGRGGAEVFDAVPWGRHAAAIVTIVSGRLALVGMEGATVTPGLGIADEPRDLVAATAEPVLGRALAAEAFDARCAAARARQIVAAAEAVLAMTVGHAGQRRQFGRPIGKFQAVQHLLAAASSEVAAAARAIADVDAIRRAGGDATFPSAIAKIAADAAGRAAAQAGHQVHGAIGYTMDYGLQRFTRRIQGWRNEFGSAATWSRFVGEQVLADADRPLWAIVTDGSTAPSAAARSETGRIG